MSSSRRCPSCDVQAPFADRRLLPVLVELEQRLDPSASQGRRWRPGRRARAIPLSPELASRGSQLHHEVHSHVHHSHWLTGARPVDELLDATAAWLREVSQQGT